MAVEDLHGVHVGEKILHDGSPAAKRCQIVGRGNLATQVLDQLVHALAILGHVGALHTGVGLEDLAHGLVLLCKAFVTVAGQPKVVPVAFVAPGLQRQARNHITGVEDVKDVAVERIAGIS